MTRACKWARFRAPSGRPWGRSRASAPPRWAAGEGGQQECRSPPHQSPLPRPHPSPHTPAQSARIPTLHKVSSLHPTTTSLPPNVDHSKARAIKRHRQKNFLLVPVAPGRRQRRNRPAQTGRQASCSHRLAACSPILSPGVGRLGSARPKRSRGARLAVRCRLPVGRACSCIPRRFGPADRDERGPDRSLPRRRVAADSGATTRATMAPTLSFLRLPPPAC